MASCRALVVTAREEFGIAAVEAQAAGRPVIARGAGGLLENVIEGETGCWWDGGPRGAGGGGRSASTPTRSIPRPASRTPGASTRRSSVRPSGVRSRARFATGRPSGSSCRCGCRAGRRLACRPVLVRGAAAQLGCGCRLLAPGDQGGGQTERNERHGGHLPVPVEPGVKRPGRERGDWSGGGAGVQPVQPDTRGPDAAEEQQQQGQPDEPQLRGGLEVERVCVRGRVRAVALA